MLGVHTEDILNSVVLFITHRSLDIYFPHHLGCNPVLCIYHTSLSLMLQDSLKCLIAGCVPWFCFKSVKLP